MSRNWLNGKFVRIEDCAPKTRRFWIELNSNTPFSFQAGQFVTLDLPIGKKPKGRWRSYSIASAPSDDNLLELVIVLLEEGKGTNYLFNEVEVGTEVRLMGPLGKFVLPKEIKNELCFVCTGTGVAPFRSMLHDLYNRKISTPEIYLIFGTRYVDDILYYEELEKLNQEWSQFHYMVALSREKSPEWKGTRGYVHRIYEDIFRNLRPADFYLCGWRGMVNEARDRIEKLGYPPSSIHREIYD